MSFTSSAITLVARVLTGDTSDEDDHSISTSTHRHICPEEPELVEEYDIYPLVGNLTFHDFAIVLAGATGLVACILSWILIARHATHYCMPGEQKQIMRIAYLVQWFVIVSFFGVLFETAAPYLKPLLLIGESFTIAAMLLFLCSCVLANDDGFEKMFSVEKHDHLHHIRYAERRYSIMRTENYSGPAWLRLCWYLAMQLIPVSFIVFIITVASKATGFYCNTSNSFLFSKSWIMWIENISIVLAVAGEVGFHLKQADELKPHGAWRKLIAFKSIVVINAIQLTTITALAGDQVILPNHYLTWDDIVYGLPNLIICCEMPLFALLFLFTYRVAPYRITDVDDPRDYRGGKFGVVAMIEALNITDILSTFIRGPIRMLKYQEIMVEKHGLDLEAIAAHKSTPYLSRATTPAGSRAPSRAVSRNGSYAESVDEERRSMSITPAGDRSRSRPRTEQSRRSESRAPTERYRRSNSRHPTERSRRSPSRGSSRAASERGPRSSHRHRKPRSDSQLRGRQLPRERTHPNFVL